MSELFMERVNILVTSACTLNCKLCGSYSPYTEPKHYPIEKMEQAVERLFTIVTHTKKFTITGGEPFLHPKLHQLLNTLSTYKNQMDVLEIITNSTLLPNQDFLAAAKDFGEKLYILMDNYGPHLSIKVQELDSLLSMWQIPHLVRGYNENDAYCGGWVDYGPSLKKKYKSQEEIEALFAKCAQPQKLKFIFAIADDGIMYPDTQYQKCKELGLVDNYDEYVDLFDESLSIEEQRQKIRHLYHVKKLSACVYCNGMCDDSTRVVPAEQLTKEEIKLVKKGARMYSEIKDMMEAGI